MSIITTERLTKILSETQAVITECNSRSVHGSVEVNARLFENVLMELLHHRAAMLQGTEPVTTTNKLPEETGSSLQLRNLIRQRHAEWSQSTFGDVGPVGPLKHLSKEALEAAAEPEDLSEWADMQFLLWDAQRRAGISDGEITAAMEEKLKVNMARQWPEPKDGEPRLHIKEAGNSPVIQDWHTEAKGLVGLHGISFIVFQNGESPQCDDLSKVIISFTDEVLGNSAATPQQDVK